MHAVGPQVGLALGLGDRLLQPAPDTVRDLAHLVLLAQLSINVFASAGRMCA